jgi:cytoskeletal protein CcmA (bactofilin family)
MWKTRKDDENPSTFTPQPPAPVAAAAPSYQPPRVAETAKMEPNRTDVAHIGKSVIIKGELSGSEDLYLDGEVEGNIDLHNHSLVIGPNGQVRANIFAKDVVIHGKVDGTVTGENRVELKKSALLNGDITTQRIVIEDGAFFKGSIDIRKGEPAKPQAALASVPVAAVVPVAAEQNK